VSDEFWALQDNVPDDDIPVAELGDVERPPVARRARAGLPRWFSSSRCSRPAEFLRRTSRTMRTVRAGRSRPGTTAK
jgi:hypothetical protein